MKNRLFFFLSILFIRFLIIGQTPGTGSDPCNALQLYPQTSCGNTSGAQYAGYFQSENAGGANVTMTGTSTLNPSCTADNETAQAIEWLAVTATTTSFTINNQTDYGNSPSLSAQEPRDYIVYSGTCSSLTQIQCFTSVAGGASVTVSGLTAGQTYYIMVSQSSSAYTACSTCTGVSTCITSTVPFTPSNNGCSTPFNMTTNVQYTSTNANATADGPSVCQNPASGSVENNVWYQWCAPANWPVGQTAYLIVNNQVCNSTQGLQLSIYAPGANCTNINSGTGTSLVCQNPGSTTDYNYSFTANPNECFLITLDGFAGVACTYNIMVSGSLCALPVLTATASNPTICSGNSTTLNASCTANCTNITYSWSPATGLSSTTGASVTATPTVTTTYTVSGSIGANCVGTQTVTVIVNPTNTVTSASSNPTICLNSSISPSITFTTTGATGIGTATGLPSGVSASFAGNTIIVSGTPTGAGTFNYTIPLTGGCGTVNATGTITVNPTNTVSAASTNPTLCMNSSISPSITFTTTGATGIGTATGLPSGVSASFSGNTITVSGTPTVSGTFNYSIPLTGGCGTITATGTITVNAINTVTSASVNPTLCVNASISPSITFTTTGATGIGTATGLPSGVSASFAGNTITVSGTPTISGTFNYSIPLTGGCGNVSAIGTITVNAINTVTIASSNPNICVGTAIPNVTFTTSGATGIGTAAGFPAGVSASWFGNNISVSGTPSVTGTFNYTIPLTGGCGVANATGTIIVNAIPTISLTPNPPSVCNGIDGSILVTGTGTGTVSWSGATTGSASVSLSYTITGLGAGNYNVTYTDGTSGCISSVVSTTIINPGAPVINAMPNLSTCGTPIQILESNVTGTNLTSNLGFYSSPGGTGPIADGTTFNSPTPSTTIYIYDFNGVCSAQVSFTVTVNPIPTVNIPTNVLVCPGALINPDDFISNPTGATFDWTNTNTAIGLPLSGNGQITNYNAPANATGALISGSISVTPSLNGCSGSAETFIISISPTPIVNDPSDVSICPGYLIDPMDFVSTPSGAIFNWTNNNTSNGLSANGTGQIASYTAPTNGTSSVISGSVTVLPILNGCVGTTEVFSININPTPIITLTATPPSTCNGSDGSILVGGNGSGTVSWSGTSTGTNTAITLNNNITNLSAGNYWVYFINSSTGCQSSSVSTLINNPDAPILDPISDFTSCNQPYTLPTITGSNLINPLYYSQPNGLGTSYAAGSVISSPASLTLFAFDSNGSCSNEQSFQIQLNPIPIISLGPTDPSVCNLSDGNILVSGTGTGTISWTGTASGSVTATSLNYTIPNLAAGIYNVFYIDDATGCQSLTSSSTLNNPNAPALINPGNQTACDSYALPIISGSNLSSNPNYWTQPGGTGTQYNSGNIISTTTTLYLFDQNGNCSDEEMFTITINNTPSILNPGNQTACESYTFPAILGTNLSGSQAYYNNSQFNGGTQINGSISSSQTVYVYDLNGTCSDEESFTVTINQLPTATISGGATYCQGDVVSDIIATISGTANFTLDYTLDGVLQTQLGTTNSFSLGNTAGTYILVSVTDANCTNNALSSTQTILINPIPNAPIAGTDTLYCDNSTPIAMTAQGAGTFIWYSEQTLTNVLGTNTTLVPSMNIGTTSYYVTETINGCESPASIVLISVEKCETIIPTAFTPDNDNTNDVWTLENIDQIYPNNVVNIYNRWGNLIYQSKTGKYETSPWDGKYNNESMPVGSYYFIIEYNDNFTENKTGIVSIIK